MDIKSEIKKNQSVLLLIKGNDYSLEAINVFKVLFGKRICYVTFNKTFGALNEILKKNKIDKKNVDFIDCITRSVMNSPDTQDNAYLISSPMALTEISLAVAKFLEHDFDYLVFDSISSLLVYHDKSTALKFISDLMAKIKASKTKAVFYGLESEENEGFFQQVGMFVDKTIKVKSKS